MRVSFETAGDIRGVDLLAAFVTLWRERTSGSVRFSRAGATAGFDFSSGEVTAVFSSEPRFATASVLIRAGKLEAAALERLSAPEGSDAALAALAAGILTKREWRWGEKIRAIEVFADMLLWPEGKYLFDAGARPAQGESALAIPRLLLELFLRSRDRNLIEHQLGPPDAPLLRAPDFEQEFMTFGLTADAESVVRLIDGRASAAEISRKAPADPFAVLKLLAALATLGLVRPAQAPSEAPLRIAPEAPPTWRQPEWSPDARDGHVPAGGETLEEEAPAEVTHDISVFPVSPPEADERFETSPEAETPAQSFDSDFPLPEEKQPSDETGGPGRRALTCDAAAGTGQPASRAHSRHYVALPGRSGRANGSRGCYAGTRPAAHSSQTVRPGCPDGLAFRRPAAARGQRWRERCHATRVGQEGRARPEPARVRARDTLRHSTRARL